MDQAALHKSRVPAAVEQFARRTKAHATSKTDLIRLVDGRVRESDANGISSGSGG